MLSLTKYKLKLLRKCRNTQGGIHSLRENVTNSLGWDPWYWCLKLCRSYEVQLFYYTALKCCSQHQHHITIVLWAFYGVYFIQKSRDWRHKLWRLFLVFLLHRILYHCFLFIYTHVPLSFSHSSCDKKTIIFNQVHMLNPLGRIVFFTSIDLQNNDLISVSLFTINL